jgi:hypothetical protein
MSSTMKLAAKSRMWDVLYKSPDFSIINGI